jgi:hypothetical protein
VITVINKYQKPNSGEYIGRGNPLGNPYSHQLVSTARYHVLTRDEAVDKYEPWLRDQVLRGNTEVCNELNRLLELAKRGDLELRCFCAPRRCHGDVIKRFLEAQLLMWSKEKNES